MCFAAVGWGLAQPASSAVVRGVVTHVETGNFVENARVVVGDSKRSTLTDSSGSFRIGGIAPGQVTLRVESSGADLVSLDLNLAAGEDRKVDVTLDSRALMMDSITVTAQAEGQAQALNLQRSSQSIRKVVSRDALAVARAGEVGEALQSLSGVYLEYSTHQPSRPVVRGLQSQFNSLTFDGVRAGNTNADRRAGVSNFPAEALQRVELYKSVTPDMNGDAIGGAINLVSRRAFDLSAPLLNLTLGVTYNDQLDNLDKDFNFDFGRTYLDSRLGVLLSLNHYRTDRGYHDTSISYRASADDEFAVNSLTLLDRVEDDSWKAKASSSVKFKVSDESLLSIAAAYSNNSRYLEDYRQVISGGSREYLTADTGNATDARYSLQRRYREPITISTQYSVGMEHDFDRWDIDYRAAYTHTSNRYQETFYPDVRTTPTSFSYDRSDPRFPTFTATGSVDINDPHSYGHNAYNRTQGPTEENLTTLNFNARRDLSDFSVPGSIKFGASSTHRKWEKGADGLGYWRYTGELPASAFIESHTNPDYMDEAGDRLLIVPLGLNMDPIFNAFYNRSEEFTRQDYASDMLIAQAEQSINEDITAAYLMGTLNFEKLEVITGARVEHTAFQGVANRITVDSGSILAVTPTPISLTDTQVLPGLHLNYTFDPQLVLRGAVYRTLARPGGRDLLPTASIDDDSQSISEGNPNLEVTESLNMDMSLEYYLKPIGVVSVGAFSKDIDGFYFTRTSTMIGGQYDGYSLKRPEMGEGGKVKGVELEWQQRLTFLPGLLSKVTLGSNFTWITSEGQYLGRKGDNLTFFGTAPRNANANISFASRGLDLRLFYNWRDDFMSGVGSRGALDVYQQARSTIDMYARYQRAGSRIRYTLNGKNLANSPLETFQGDRSNPRSLRFFDWSVSASIGIDL